MKSFSNYGELLQYIDGKSLFMRVTNGYSIPTTHEIVDGLAHLMAECGDNFLGMVIFNETAATIILKQYA